MPRAAQFPRAARVGISSGMLLLFLRTIHAFKSADGGLDRGRGVLRLAVGDLLFGLADILEYSVKCFALILVAALSVGLLRCLRNDLLGGPRHLAGFRRLLGLQVLFGRLQVLDSSVER